MKRMSRSLAMVVIAAAVLLAPMAQPVMAQSMLRSSTTQYAVEPSPESMTADGLVLRPAGIVGSAIGIGVWVVTLPWSILGQNVNQATNELIEEPLKYTFTRPLGSF